MWQWIDPVHLQDPAEWTPFWPEVPHDEPAPRLYSAWCYTHWYQSTLLAGECRSRSEPVQVKDMRPWGGTFEGGIVLSYSDMHWYLPDDAALDLAVKIVSLLCGDLVRVSDGQGVVQWNLESKFLQAYSRWFMLPSVRFLPGDDD